MIRGPTGLVWTEVEGTGPVLTALQALHQSLADNIGKTATVFIEETRFRALDGDIEISTRPRKFGPGKRFIASR